MRRCVASYTANGHDLRFFKTPHPSPLPKGEGEKAAISARVEYTIHGSGFRLPPAIPDRGRLCRNDELLGAG